MTGRSFPRGLAVALLGLAALSACVAPKPAPRDTDGAVLRASFDQTPLPPMKRFPPGPGTPARRSNADMTRDFMDLSFRLETGRPLDAFSRFTGPLSYRLTGVVPPTAASDLGELIARLRSEAGLGLSAASPDEQAAITIEFLPRRQLQARARDAACFVAPRVSSWAEYRRARASDLDWTTFTFRDRVAIFIPSDTGPQEIRDCLNEEMAQALGPLNDLYRLPDSVFNDDNIEGRLTGFDMLMLRATYAPDLSPGMSPGEIEARIPGILARLNPGGARPADYPPQTPRAFGEAIARALGPGGRGGGGRVRAAEEALAIARPWADWRTGFAWISLGRVLPRDRLGEVRAAFANASALYRARGLPLHAAHADLQRALLALSDGAYRDALALADAAVPAARTGRDAALLAGLLAVRAAALERTGQPDAARAARLDSLGWARYGMASDKDVRARLAFIEALAPDQGR
ncbi:DUF2927 domain-containing protein [Frigidibacter sp. SD6-1]|uniref:DUF2927 domain-containing protein n=1 Tax=Frigidibacter sp. SD6-1 TaxID=3032581 RepID=UPI0024DF4D78|nr:DUF2927 domain-containing protein [Frigidibacter sp. SD6-1]